VCVCREGCARASGRDATGEVVESNQNFAVIELRNTECERGGQETERRVRGRSTTGARISLLARQLSTATKSHALFPRAAETYLLFSFALLTCARAHEYTRIY